MSSEFTIGNVTYQIGGPNKDSIGLSMKLDSLPAELSVNGGRMVRKRSFHVTLVPVGNIVERHAINDANFFQNVLKDFQEFVEQRPIRFLRFTDEFRIASQDGLRTIVGMCQVENLEKFYQIINAKYHMNLEIPPTHITLYTLNGGLGIWLIDSTDLATLTQVIENPGLNMNL